MTQFNQEDSWRSGLRLAILMSGWLVGPVVIATVVGYFLDQRYGTKPWLFLISLGLAFTLSSLGLVKTVNDSLKELNEDKKAQDKNQVSLEKNLENDSKK